MQKNVASQYIQLFAFDSATGLPKTGDAANISLYISKDNGSTTLISSTAGGAAGTPSEQDATNALGWYKIALTQAETNADMLLFTGKSGTSGIVIAGCRVFTTPPNFNASSITSGGIIDANVKQTDGSTFHNYDGTFAAVTAATDVTFPTTDALSNSIPDDARYEWSVFRLVSGSGTEVGQLLLTTTKTGTRKFAYLSAFTPVSPTTSTTYQFMGKWVANATYLLNSATAATNLKNEMLAMVVDSVAASPSPSTTVFAGSSALSSSDGFYSTPGSVLAFTSGTLIGKAAKTTGYTGATRTFTFANGFPTAPGIGDNFVILGLAQ